jgi:hypothetical protein
MNRFEAWVLGKPLSRAMGYVPPTEKPVFSDTQRVGVAAAIIVSPWFWPVALYPSLVRKTVSIAATAKARAEATAVAASKKACAEKTEVEAYAAYLQARSVARAKWAKISATSDSPASALDEKFR